MPTVRGLKGLKKLNGFPEKALAQLPRRMAAGVVRGYQLLVSPVLPGSCRYHPSCSAYAIDALNRHGFFKGAWLGLGRIVRCHPWGGEGFDPVPGTASKDDGIITNER